MKRPNKRELEAAARRAADPLSQVVGRDDIDYEHEDLPAAPRSSGYARPAIPRVPPRPPVLPSRGIKFRTPTRCQNGHFRYLYYSVEFGKCLDLAWSEKHPDCNCATHELNEGFAKIGPDEQFTRLLDSKGEQIYEGDRVRLAGYGDYTAEFPFIELYQASFENDIGEILGHIYEDKQ